MPLLATFITTIDRLILHEFFLSVVCLQHYAVMDASEHRVFLAVEHANSSDIHLYISDAEGVYYSLSLDHVVATEDWGNDDKPSFDIHVVSHIFHWGEEEEGEGVEGITEDNSSAQLGRSKAVFVPPLPPSL